MTIFVLFRHSVKLRPLALGYRVSERVKGKCRNELWDVILSTIDCNIANFNETFSEVSQVLDDIGFTAESQNNVKNWVPVGLGKNEHLPMFYVEAIAISAIVKPGITLSRQNSAHHQKKLHMALESKKFIQPT